jgi:hypothetical protein
MRRRLDEFCGRCSLRHTTLSRDQMSEIVQTFTSTRRVRNTLARTTSPVRP